MTESDAGTYAEKIAKMLFTASNGDEGVSLSLMGKDTFPMQSMNWDYVVENVRRILGETIKPKKSCQACEDDITDGGYLIGWNELCEECAKKAADLLVAK